MANLARSNAGRRATSRIGFALALGCLAASCSAVGVMESDDPRTKIAQAQEMQRVGRMAVAKRLLLEAVDTAERRRDQLALAEAYRQYAFYVRTNGEDTILTPPGAAYVPTNEDGRMDKSIDYFEKALAIFEANGMPDMAANVHYNIGTSHFGAGRLAETCLAFDRSLNSHLQAKRLRPDAAIDLPAGIATFPELIERAKDETKCRAAL